LCTRLISGLSSSSRRARGDGGWLRTGQRGAGGTLNQQAGDFAGPGLQIKAPQKTLRDLQSLK